MVMKGFFLFIFGVLGGSFIWMGWAYPDNTFGWSRDWVSLVLLNILGLAIIVFGFCVLFGCGESEQTN